MGEGERRGCGYLELTMYCELSLTYVASRGAMPKMPLAETSEVISVFIIVTNA